MQPRGKPARMWSGGSGSVRALEREHIVAALDAAALGHKAADALHKLFRRRIAVLDAPPPSLRESGGEVKRASIAAEKLLSALAILPAELLVDVEGQLYEARGFTGPRPDARDLFAFLVGIQSLADQFHPADTAQGYRATIAAAFAAFDEPPNDAAMTRFLNALESQFPRLCYSSETVASGRYQAVRRGRKMLQAKLSV
jgi:hypothetical protein